MSKYAVYNKKFEKYHKGGAPFVDVEIDDAKLYQSLATAKRTVNSIVNFDYKFSGYWNKYAKYAQPNDLEIHKIHVVREVSEKLRLTFEER